MTTRNVKSPLPPILAAVVLAAVTFAGICPATAQETDYEVPVNRQVLPIAAPWQPPIKVFARDTKAPPVFQVKAPKDAPNVVIIMIDDLGFGGTSAFGGVTPTPTFDKLAQIGLMYNHFHSTALCSPTRQALLTGRNHHSVNMGSITETATSFPGNTGVLPADCTKLPEILRLNGYSTGHFGKCHEVAVWEISPSGPLTRWPTLSGFDKFYGFLGGETNQWSPAIYDGITPVDNPGKGNPDYHFLNDMTTQAINWVRAQQSLTPDKPFFTYFVPGDDLLQRCRGEGRRHAQKGRPAGQRKHLSSHGGRLGGRLRLTLHLDQAGLLELWRDTAGHGHSLAEPHQSQRRAAHAVASRDRHCTNDSGGGRAASASAPWKA